MSKGQWIVSILVAGCALVGLSFYLAITKPEAQIQQLRLAKVDRETGHVSAIRVGMYKKDPVQQKMPLFSLDSVETNETGEALITFENSFRVRVLTNALVTLEKLSDAQNSSAVLLIVKRGEIKVESLGREGDLIISKNGEHISALEYNNSTLSQTPAVNISENHNSSQGLTDADVTATINNHRSSFYKCYTQLLQKDPTAKGQSSVHFTIENSGKMTNVEVSASDINDVDFKKCLVEVLKRIEFPPFQGPVVSTTFPLRFE